MNDTSKNLLRMTLMMGAVASVAAVAGASLMSSIAKDLAQGPLTASLIASRPDPMVTGSTVVLDPCTGQRMN